MYNLFTGTILWSWSHETHNKDIHAVLRDSFEYHETKGQFGIGDSLTLAEDPTEPGHFVMRVFYEQGKASRHFVRQA